MKSSVFHVCCFMVAACVVAACDFREFESPVEEVRTESVDYVLKASVAGTRTTNAGYSTVWSESDSLSVFYSHEAEYERARFDYMGDDSFSGRINDPDDGCDWYAVYPTVAAGAEPESVIVKADAAPAQNGCSSMSHLAGAGFPLFGVAENVSISASPSFAMTQLLSVAEFCITNNESDDIVIKSIEFTAPVPIAGACKIDLTASPIGFEAVEGQSSSTVVLTVDDADALGKGASASFYVGLFPFDVTGDFQIKVNAECDGVPVFSKKDITLRHFSFESGKINKLNYKFVASSPETPKWETTYAVFASDRHGNTTAFSTATLNMPSTVPYVCLIGDMVGSGGGDAPSYNSSTVRNEVTSVWSSATAQIVWGSHDDNVTDDAGIVYGDTAGSSGLIYTQKDSKGNVQYYVYGIAYYDMSVENNGQSAAAAFESWVGSISDKTIPVFVACHMPIHASRKDNYGAYYWNRALTFAATGSETGTKVERNVVFFHGHNHTNESNKEYYYAPGSTLSVARSSGTVSCTIPYTYITGGYLNANKKATLVTVEADTMTFTKYGNGSSSVLGTVDRIK